MNWIDYKEANTEYLLCCETGAHFRLSDTDNAIRYTAPEIKTELANTFENHDEAVKAFADLRSQLGPEGY